LAAIHFGNASKNPYLRASASRIACLPQFVAPAKAGAQSNQQAVFPPLRERRIFRGALKTAIFCILTKRRELWVKIYLKNAHLSRDMKYQALLQVLPQGGKPLKMITVW